MSISKKIFAVVAIFVTAAMPLASNASVLGFATNGDLTSLQSQINLIQSEIDYIHAELASFDTGNLGSQLPSSPALVDTYLASGIGTTDTSMVLAVGTTSDGVTLAGYMCFTLDVNTPQLEYVCGNASGTAVTGLQRGIGFWNPNTTSTALAFTHRRFASVQSTDYPVLQLIVRQLTGQDGVSSTNPLFYDNTQTCTSANQICPKSYIDGVATSGAADAGLGSKGLIKIITPNQAATSTDGSQVLYGLISKQFYASSTQGATNTVIMTRETGQIDTSFISQSSTYTWTGSSTFSNILSARVSTATSTATSTDNFNLIPAGVIEMYATSTAPAAWLLCDGTEYATSSYPRLWTMIGYTYGGSTSTFRVPNLGGRFVAGPSSTLSTTLGATGGATSTNIAVNGTLSSSGNGATGGPAGNITISTLNFSASGVNSIIPPYMILNYIIKY